MSKLTTMRQRVHQPWRDSLIRSSGYFQGGVAPATELFQDTGGSLGERNLKSGSVLPSDQSMIILILRVFLWFRHSVARSVDDLTNQADATTGRNGDFFITAAQNANAVNTLNGSVPGDYHDVHRLYWQASEQILWSFGTGDKFDIKAMPSWYFPAGGGLHGDIGGVTDLVHWNNGTPDHAGALRLGRCICLPPRQNIKCEADIVSLPLVAGRGAGGTAPATFSTSQGDRNMMSLVDNLNSADLIQKCVSFIFDGLFSRDVS